MPTVDIFYSAHPKPPMPAGPVGAPPIVYLNLLPNTALHIASLGGLVSPHNQIDRLTLRTICRDHRPTELAKFACIMAWGGQRLDHFNRAISAHNLPCLIAYLVASTNARGHDFDYAKVAAIPGLGISFFTKILFFLRPLQDAYILDQWTAKSLALLAHPSPIPLSPLAANGYLAASPHTTGAQYDSFCKGLEAMAGKLGGTWIPGTPGYAIEEALFDRNRPDGFWRAFTRLNFTNHTAGNLLQTGAESLTGSLDYHSGYVILKRHNKPRIFVIHIRGGCRSWEREDLYRFLLGRLKELNDTHGLPITVVLPSGPDCPPWFQQALKDLMIELEVDDNSGDSDGEGDDEIAPDPIPDPPAPIHENAVVANRQMIKITANARYFWGLRHTCGVGNENGGNYWGNVSTAGVLSIKQPTQDILHAAAVPNVNQVLNPWIAGPNPNVGGAGYVAHRDFGTPDAAFKFLAKYFDLCACDQKAVDKLRDFDICWIPPCE